MKVNHARLFPKIQAQKGKYSRQDTLLLYVDVFLVGYRFVHYKLYNLNIIMFIKCWFFIMYKPYNVLVSLQRYLSLYKFIYLSVYLSVFPSIHYQSYVLRYQQD